MLKSFDVLAIGEPMVEFNQTASDECIYSQGYGGDTSNAVIAAARAGAKVAYMSRLGYDRFGDALLQLWAKEGVDASAIERDDKHPTGIYFVHHTDKGHEFTYLRSGSAASHMSKATLVLKSWVDAISQTKIFHVSGISLAISESARSTALVAMRMARQEKAYVSFDTNMRLKLWQLDVAKEAIKDAAKLSDIFLPSFEDLKILTELHNPDDMVDWAHTLGPKFVVLKLGAEGALVSDGLRRERILGRQVPAVDATGAGDCFCGNLLARYAAGDDIFTAAHYANVAASLAVQGYGAVAPLPTLDQVKALL